MSAVALLQCAGCVVALLVVAFVWNAFMAPARDELLLALLSDGREWRGLDLVHASDGKLVRGMIHEQLTRLEAAGLVSSRLEDETDPRIGIRRRLYRLVPGKPGEVRTWKR